MTDSAQQTALRQKIQQARWDCEPHSRILRSELESILVPLAFSLSLNPTEVLHLRALGWGLNDFLLYDPNVHQPELKDSVVRKALQEIAMGSSGNPFQQGHGLEWVKDRLKVLGITELESELRNLETVLQPLKADFEAVT